MKTITVMLSRPYSVELEVEDDFDWDEVEQIARDKVIDAEHLYSGQLVFDCIEFEEE